MVQFKTMDTVLAERLQKEFGFKVIGMGGKPKTYLFTEDEEIINAKLGITAKIEIPLVATKTLQEEQPEITVKRKYIKKKRR